MGDYASFNAQTACNKQCMRVVKTSDTAIYNFNLTHFNFIAHFLFITH